ncbi:ABC transporter ATP-binding protein [Ketogulonicigenium robustum]|uniref:ABC transporter ATP-binding protein n=1 Tax=Ketogulonicigenium robustum TaxID=92947 RepID=A0A1W6NX00_9RHOB|nr:ABC transporter ATP-binding protein [Ketogulonicigenium robustum]ARO13721.1 ABC transporter ATP-binding protein [Ketogulonicigenium robustum]
MTHSKTPILQVENLQKRYPSGFTALNGVNLTVGEGEILALLGPNGAGKTTLISSICGISRPTGGRVLVGGHDIQSDYRAARSLIGLVPQELTIDGWEPVMQTIRYSRGLFGRPANEAYLRGLLDRLSLADKADSRVNQLSGGMKRRVLIGKALAHEPRILFLDEPTAGVDVELRRDMWDLVADLKAQGVTIILTTHYLEEAEAIADRVAVIDKGQILLVEDKDVLMRQMGRKFLRVMLDAPLSTIPEALAREGLTLEDGGRTLLYTYDTHAERTGIRALLNDLNAVGLRMVDLKTHESSLEEIFINLVKGAEQ